MLKHLLLGKCKNGQCTSYVTWIDTLQWSTWPTKWQSSKNFQGFLDGIVDLGLVRRIEKRDLPRNFGFSVETYEGKTVIFSAITDGIRNSWITCLKKAAGLENQVKDDSNVEVTFENFDAEILIMIICIVFVSQLKAIHVFSLQKYF